MKNKKYTNYQMIIYSKSKCNPLQCALHDEEEEEEEERSPLLLLFEKLLSIKFRCFTPTSRRGNNESNEMLRVSRIYSFRHHGVRAASAQQYGLVPESSKFQMERHNLPEKKDNVYSYFIFAPFFFIFLHVHCTTLDVLCILLVGAH